MRPRLAIATRPRPLGAAALSQPDIDDQVPHRVDQPAFLHVQAEQLIHRKLENFSERTHSHREHKREECDKTRPQVQIHILHFIQNINEEKSEDPEQKSGADMQHSIPPPKSNVVAMLPLRGKVTHM